MKITIHRALAMKKSTADRIARQLQETKFIELTRGKSGKVNGTPMAEVERDIQSGYASLEGLMSNYDKICQGIADSNAVTKVTVNGEELTVAQLLTRLQKGGWLESKERLLQTMREVHGRTVRKLEQDNVSVANRLDDLLRAMAGGDKKSLSAAEIAQQSELYHEGNDLKLVDPLGLADRIKQLEKQLADFRTESDAVLSESNAVTVMEIDLTE